MINQNNKKILTRFINELYNKKNLSIVDELVDENYVTYSPFIDQKDGRSGLKIAVLTFFQSFPDLHVKIEDLIASDNKVAARLVVSGTHEQEFMGIPPSHKKFSYPEISIVRFVNSKLTEHWAVSDVLEMMNQVEKGVIDCKNNPCLTLLTL